MSSPDRAAIEAEMKRTAYQKKAVTRLPATEVLALAMDHFKARGYRSAPTGRPNHIYIMGQAEGILPRVNGEIGARADVGRPGVTLVTMDAFGEVLGATMKEFHAELRALRQSGK